MSEEKIPEATPERRPRTSPQKRRQQSALRYITIQLGAAFVLLLFTFLMERRQNELLMQENQEQIEDLQQSVSAVNSLKGLYAENEQLKVSIQELEEQLEQLTAEHEALTESFVSTEEAKTNAEKGLQAMDWFWQIDEAYAKGRYSLCRSLITSLDEAGLTEYLPKESITDNDRFSPYDRLAEIREIVY